MTKLVLKAHIKGYTRKDGVYVKPHDDGKAPAKAKPAPGKKVFYSKPKPAPVPYGVHHNESGKPRMVFHHPQLGETGHRVVVNNPSQPSPEPSWKSPDKVAVFVPKGIVPKEINGIVVAPWEDAPETDGGWAFVDGTLDIKEPPLKMKAGMRPAAGVIIEEPDGRVWVISPTNAFGGYKNTFPKGGAEKGLSLQQNAIKEAWEESGLKIEITGILGDFERTTSIARMYTARRVGGDPTTMGWETQAVQLVPKEKLLETMNMPSDKEIVARYLAKK